jgi:hypothetical protein
MFRGAATDAAAIAFRTLPDQVENIAAGGAGAAPAAS